MWWQSKEFGTDREADRLARSGRGYVVALAVVLVPPVVLLLQWLVRWALEALGYGPSFTVTIIPG